MTPHKSGQRILVVGRDPLLRRLRAEVLKTRGYAVYPASNYDDALTRCKPGSYDAVLVSGEEDKDAALEFCEKVRQFNPQQVVLVIVRPHVYLPADACPDDVVENGRPVELIKTLESALA